jgi:hypothetical protein
MDDLLARRRIPFAVVGAIVVVVTVAVFRLPELFVSQLRRDAVLPDARGMWGFRILLGVAIGQAVFGGYRVLRAERIATVETEKIATEPDRGKLVSAAAWFGAGMIALSLVYSVASFVLTGLRAGHWAFVALIVAQGLWYYRLVGEFARWLERQPAPPPGRKTPWTRGDADYTPPIARGLTPLRSTAVR